MAGYRAPEHEGGEHPDRAAANDAPREGWSTPVARIERGANGRMLIRVGGRRVETEGEAPRRGG
jgi:hypothetical protein